MYYIIEHQKLQSCDFNTMIQHEAGIGYCTPSELEQLTYQWQLPSDLSDKILHETHAIHCNYETYDLFVSQLMINAQPQRIAVLMSHHSLIFFGNETISQHINHYLLNIINKVKPVTLNRVLYWIIEQQLQDDTINIDLLENQIETLQTAIMSHKQFTNIQQIIDLRSKVVQWKQYFEEMTIILDNLEENENELIDPSMINLFQLLNHRAQRLLVGSIDLKEAITHVHDTYQMLIDISLNSTMKVFTVVSTIFLPLTLVTSWYGMNLKMPEFTWTHGYYYVMGLCIIVIAVCIWLFKRRGWF
jgi:magnesium transporter